MQESSCKAIVASALSVLAERLEPIIQWMMMYYEAHAANTHQSRENPLALRLVGSSTSSRVVVCFRRLTEAMREEEGSFRGCDGEYGGLCFGGFYDG